MVYSFSKDLYPHHVSCTYFVIYIRYFILLFISLKLRKNRIITVEIFASYQSKNKTFSPVDLRKGFKCYVFMYWCLVRMFGVTRFSISQVDTSSQNYCINNFK